MCVNADGVATELRGTVHPLFMPIHRFIAELRIRITKVPSTIHKNHRRLNTRIICTLAHLGKVRFIFCLIVKGTVPVFNRSERELSADERGKIKVVERTLCEHAMQRIFGA